MDFSILTTSEELHDIHSHWEDLHRNAKGTVFQSYEWMSECWNILGLPHQLFVIAAWEGTNLAGIFPAYKQKSRLGPFSFTRLRFLGEGTVYGEYQPLALPECENRLYEHAASLCARELSERRCDAIDFQFTRRGSVFASLFPQALAKQGVHIHAQSRPASRVIIELPGSWDDYLNTLSPKQRQLLKRHRRTLRDNGATLQVTSQPSEFVPIFGDLVQLHEGVWEQRGTFGRFTGLTDLEPFLRKVLPLLMAKGQAKVYSLVADGSRIAIVLLFVSPGFACSYISGRKPEHPLSKFSPGTALRSICIEDAISQGCRIFDFLGGQQPHKLRLGGQPTSYARIVGFAEGVKGIVPRMAYTGAHVSRTLMHFGR